MRLLLSTLCAACFLFTPLLVDDANAQVTLGPRVGFDLGDADNVFIGTDARIGAFGSPVILAPAFDYYFTDLTSINIDVNLLYFFAEDPQLFVPYAGAGFGFYRVLDDVDESDLGLNLLFGADLGTGDLRPYVQAKTNFGGDVTLVNVMIGFVVTL